VPHNLVSLRSLLFTPADDPSKLARALTSGADAVVADLEDAVAQSRKAEARERVVHAFAARGSDGPARFVRVNGVGTPHFEADAALLSEIEIDGVVVPKATPEAVDELRRTGLPALAIVETAIGLRQAYEIARRENVFALLLGAIDLGAELGLEPRPDGLEILHARSTLVVDSAAARIRPPFDCVHSEIADLDGLAAEARLARSLGLGGKGCIHPAQVAVVNAAFTANPEQVAWAREVIRAAEGAEAEGRGALAVAGMLVDAPVVARARHLLGEHEMHKTP
jgi:citrate lyase subunit beta/citryl-CoA lyase